MQNETRTLIDRAIAGDKKALEALMMTVQDMVFTLSLRMLGNVQDAEDATQEIFIRIITGLSSFKGESAFSTWAYRVAANHLLNYKKSMFAKMPPLSFEYYGADIENGYDTSAAQDLHGVDRELLSEELKMSCTNVMLQCFDAESRLVYVLGTMFRVDSKVAGEILGIAPEAYRQRLSRLKKKMAGFLKAYCGLASPGKCSCSKRVEYAIETHRLHPKQLPYTALTPTETERSTVLKEAMEEMDEQSAVFEQLPAYQATVSVRDYLDHLLASPSMGIILAEE